MSFLSTRFLCALILLLAGGCSSTKYRYAAPSGVARYQPEGSEGDIRILAIGPADVTPSQIRVMHMRIDVVNDDPHKVWTVSTADQRLFLPGEGSNQPAYIDAGIQLGSLPEVAIGPGETKNIDLYYVLPHRLREASEIPRFSFEWKIQVGKQTVDRITVFDRESMPKQIARLDPGPTWHKSDSEIASSR